jgi:hypothetical protein
MSKRFDLVTHKRNKKGSVTSTNFYTLHIVNGVRKFERPKGSGIFYAEDGSLLADKKAKPTGDMSKLSADDKKALQALVEGEMNLEADAEETED